MSETYFPLSTVNTKQKNSLYHIWLIFIRHLLPVLSVTFVFLTEVCHDFSSLLSNMFKDCFSILHTAIQYLSTLYGSWRFIITFTSARTCPYPSQSNPVHVPHPTSWRSILILSPSMPMSFKWSPAIKSPTKTLYAPLLFPLCATCPTQPISQVLGSPK